MTAEKFDYDKQKLYLECLVGDPDTFIRCQTILNEKHWDKKLQPTVKYMLEYAAKWNALPDLDQIKADTKLDLADKKITLQQTNWLLSEVEEFTRHKALEYAVLDAADAINKGKYGSIEESIRDALTISINSDLGLEYWQDPSVRIKNVLENRHYMSTGWSTLDHVLYGGFQKGGLNIFAGGSGSGKSLLLQNLSLNWLAMGLDGIYFSIELAETLVSTRFDSMISGFSGKEVFKRINEVSIAVKSASKTYGNFMIKKLPDSGTTTNMLRAYLKEYEIQKGKRPDFIVVDYLDIVHPNNSKINPSDLFIKDKYVSEELRGLAHEYDCLFATASQLNRGSVNTQFLDHSHIAGGMSKINTADNVFGIFSSDALKEDGKIQLQMLKTRSSGGVGGVIDLAFNPTTLRIKDMLIEDDGSNINPSNNFLKELKSIGEQRVDDANDKRNSMLNLANGLD